jgi:hypothetical protein
MEAKGMHGVGNLMTYILTLGGHHILQALGKQNSRNHADGRTTPIVQVLGLRSIIHRIDSRTDWEIGRKDMVWQNVSASITTATKEKKTKVIKRLDLQADVRKKNIRYLFVKTVRHDGNRVLMTKTAKQKSSERPNSLELQRQLLTAARPPGLPKISKLVVSFPSFPSCLQSSRPVLQNGR